MTVNGQLVARSPAGELREQLDDPNVAGALRDILEHADLLALLVQGLDGVVRRGDEITEAVADGVRELSATVGRPAALADVDLPALLSSLNTLSGGVVAAAPTLSTLLHSPLLTDDRTAATLSLFGEALVEARTAAATAPAAAGRLGLLRMLRDDDVARGLRLLIEVARALGRRTA